MVRAAGGKSAWQRAGRVVAWSLAVLALSGCGRQDAAAPNAGAPVGSSQVSPSVARTHAQATELIKNWDTQTMADAQRGLVAKPTGQILAADGAVLKDFDAFAFLNGPAAPTVNPSLWRHAQINAQAGLFKVMDGVWQLRGFDIANMTLIQGQTGWIVVDPLSARESAAFALAFARQHLGNRPVSAVIYTHAHVDHFGGVLGVVSAQEAAERKLPIIASHGFMEEATSENIMVGTAMGRRSMYQFGKNLPRNATGNVDTGLGKDVVYGAVGVLPPTFVVFKPRQPMTLDGLDFVFYDVPGAECPAELTFTIPSLKLYNGAEIVAHTLHNLLPIRGAKVRDALLWSRYLQNALDELGDTQVFIGQHGPPIWGPERIREHLSVQRDAYKYTHDQTVRHINQGLGPNEIADIVSLPDSIARHPAARGYYGDMRHNVKAVYQHYLGLYDGNPANLNPLAPVEKGKRYLALLGPEKLMQAAQAAFDADDLRWAAELLNHLVMADAKHQAARELLARTHEQMAYAAESATWRNAYLTAAMELRQGPPTQGVNKASAVDMLRQVPVQRFLEAMAASLNAESAAGVSLRVNLVVTDLDEAHTLLIHHSVMHHRLARPGDPAPNATVRLTRDMLVRVVAGTAKARDLLTSDELSVSGSRLDLVKFFGLLDKAPGTFAIVHR